MAPRTRFAPSAACSATGRPPHPQPLPHQGGGESERGWRDCSHPERGGGIVVAPRGSGGVPRRNSPSPLVGEGGRTTGTAPVRVLPLAPGGRGGRGERGKG